MAENNKLMQLSASLTDAVQRKVTAMTADGSLDLPSDYSAGNALKAMQLMVNECKDRNGRPALSVCTQESVMQAMLSMVVQGLNPNKMQCYPIVYGDKLTLMRSYHGAVAVAMRVDPSIVGITAQVVYKDDVFNAHYASNGRLVIDEHKTNFMKMDKANIVGAYAIVEYESGECFAEWRTFEQIKEAWKHSSRHPVNADGTIKEGTTHATETEDMCRRTVINRICKWIINQSSDSSIVAQYARKTDDDIDFARSEERISVDANTGEYIDVDFTEVEPDAERAAVQGEPSGHEPEQESEPETVSEPMHEPETTAPAAKAPAKSKSRAKREAEQESVAPEMEGFENPFDNL